VWDRPAPKKVARRGTTHLTEQQKEHAKRRAQRAGRNYPNLVDNIHEAAEAHPKSRKAAPKKARQAPKARKAAKTRGDASTAARRGKRATTRKAAARRSGS
jgi:hypothetical protein